MFSLRPRDGGELGNMEIISISTAEVGENRSKGKVEGEIFCEFWVVSKVCLCTIGELKIGRMRGRKLIFSSATSKQVGKKFD
jgi:hypothetical protein